MRNPLNHPRHLRGALACTLLAASCGGDAIGPDPVSTAGAIRVTVSTTGFDRPSSYSILVDGRSASSNQEGVATIAGLSPGTHSVRLIIALNCAVEGQNPRTATVVAGETATLAFVAMCAATTGAVRLTVATTGVDPDPNGYTIRIEGFTFAGVRFSQASSIGTNETAILSGVPTGVQSAAVAGLSVNCDLAGANPREVTVVAAETVAVALDIVCTPATGQLAYVMTSPDGRPHIHIINANGSGSRRLSSDPAADEDPAWSPDGKRIAFTTDRDRNREIYTIGADGSGAVRLTSDAAADYHPAWSPDGSRIAFVSERAGDAEIFVMNVDGTNVVRLTNHPARDGEPAWSPDGRQIAFTSNRDGRSEIYVMNADGSGPTRLTTEGGSHAAWSPDGTRLALSSPYCAGYPYACYASVHVKAGPQWSRPSKFGPGEHPAWSPDGRKIAYSALECDFYFIRCEHSGIRIGRVDDSDVVDLGGGVDPAWRP